MKLHDKVAIVTGGARGIGAAVAGRYGAEGALVVIAGVNEEGAQRTAPISKLRAAGRSPVEISRERWGRLFEVNAKGLFFMLQAAARQMIDQGHGGKIINLASQAGRFGVAMVLHHCATEAAVISITQSAAARADQDRINVNAIPPGWSRPRCGRWSISCTPGISTFRSARTSVRSRPLAPTAASGAGRPRRRGGVPGLG